MHFGSYDDEPASVALMDEYRIDDKIILKKEL